MTLVCAELAPFKALIKERCGLLFEGASEAKLHDALALRRSHSASPDWNHYLLHLRRHEGEFQELVNLLTINETYFFRENEQIQLLCDTLLPRLLAHRQDGRPLRLLSAGCSSGEEPYSLAMALHRKYGEQLDQLVEFVGGDIDSAVLAKARAGRYTEFSFRGVPAELRQRYFDRHGWHYQLKDEIRQRVSFHELNLLADSFPAALHGCDVIFFRNVSIYFDAPTRRQIQQHLASLLKPDGLLVIGTAETLANDLGVLPLVEENGLFYFAQGRYASSARPSPAALSEAPRPLPPLTPPPLSALPAFDWAALSRTPPPPPPAAAPLDLDTLRQLLADKRYAEAEPQLQARLASQPSDPAAQLLHAYLQLNRKDFSSAAASAQRVLAADPWQLDALLLAGLAAKWSEQADEALRQFKQAVYSCHSCWPAHYHLAELYRSRGEPQPASRAYRTVLQLLNDPAADSCGGLRLIPHDLPASEIRFLCEHQLRKLDPANAAPAPR